MSASSKPTPIAIPNELHEMIEKASKLAGLSKQDTMRLAMRIGLADLERCNYDLAGAILDRARGPSGPDSAVVLGKAAAKKTARNAISRAISTDFFVVTRKG